MIQSNPLTNIGKPRVQMFDGDELVICEDTNFIEALRRTRKRFNCKVNYYAGEKAPKQTVNSDAFVWAITTASKFNIGTVSNGLTKCWNNGEFIKALEQNNEEKINRFIQCSLLELLHNQGEMNRRLLM